MAERRSSPTSDAPEAVPNQQRSTFGYVGSDDYEYFEPPPSAFERHRSPVPEYQRYENGTSTTSPRISAASPPPPSSDIGRSPAMSDSGFSTAKRPLSPSVQYSEVHSPDPQMAYDQADKEAVYSAERPRSKVPSYYATPVPGNIQHHGSNDNPQVWNNQPDQYNEKQKKIPFYKRWWFWLILLIVIVAIAVGVACGVVFGTKKHKNNSGSNNSTSNGTTGDNPNVDINAAVGGYINPAYYSKSGAWNGSGIAIAGANTATDQSIYAFYQDYTGQIQYTLMNPQYEWQIVGPVNADSPRALNGTPLSTVQHQLGNELVWHVFYIDEDYYIRERIITNTSTNGPAPVWSDGPLSSQNLKTWESDTIGMQACYWGNYYGEWSYNVTEVSAGIHLWFASDATVFEQYSWTNGTDKWTRDQQWQDLSGNAGVGCQTWDTGMTEYVWFVDTNGKLAMSWRDNNKTVNATADHPVGQWTPVDIGITGVQKSSSLGYTNYMIYQANDTTIHGANIAWAAENTTIYTPEGASAPDIWTLQAGGQDIHAVRGTHASITALTTASKGASLLVFFQDQGDDVHMMTRDAYSPGAVWQPAGQDPVTPATSS